MVRVRVRVKVSVSRWRSSPVAPVEINRKINSDELEDRYL